MANFVLVAGTFHGGWYWDSLADKLRALGHRVFTPTLSGLQAEGANTSPINLDTHIDDVLAVISENELTNITLVGWSYGGMVVTGVADRTSAHINRLIYLDAIMPKPGQCEWDLDLDEDKPGFLASCTDGLNLQPPEFLVQMEPRVRPHPLATKLQPLFYDQQKFDSFAKVFVFAEKWFHDPRVASPFKPILERVQSEPGWATQTWPYGHDLLNEAPEEVYRLLVENASA
ncbi:MAG: hypothetical protein RL009_538 [Actinomycetota bacterium]|jgi:pimeloyl-ACP methyl ester carboxylesterase